MARVLIIGGGDLVRATLSGSLGSEHTVTSLDSIADFRRHVAADPVGPDLLIAATSVADGTVLDLKDDPRVGSWTWRWPLLVLVGDESNALELAETALARGI